MTFTRKMLVAALTVTTLAMGALATAGDASAKGFKGGGGGGFKGGGFHGHKHGHFHGGHGHRWWGPRYAGFYSYGAACYFVQKPSGLLVRICPDYDY